MAPIDPAKRARLSQAQGFFVEPWSFDFFQAVKVVEGWVRWDRRVERMPEPEPAGSTLDPRHEALTFSSAVSFAFRPSDISELRFEVMGQDVPRMQVDFLGLAGARGPMPSFYTELIRDRHRVGDYALRDFFDLFNHRLVALLYRIRQRNRPSLSTDRPDRHPFAGYLLSLAGLRSEAAQSTFDEARVNDDNPSTDAIEGISARDMLFYSGLLWHRERSMHGLEQLLSHFFAFPVKGHELHGRWIRLPDDARTALSTKPHQNRLGQTAVAGKRVWDPQAGFVLQVGPVNWDTFLDFLPTGERFSALLRLTRYYIRSAFDFGLRMRVETDEIHERRPGLSSDLLKGPRLGWTSWLTTKPLTSTLEEVNVSSRTIDFADELRVDASVKPF